MHITGIYFKQAQNKPLHRPRVSHGKNIWNNLANASVEPCNYCGTWRNQRKRMLEHWDPYRESSRARYPGQDVPRLESEGGGLFRLIWAGG